MASSYGEVEPENERDSTERDRRLESTYHYERDKDSRGESELSTVAYVSAHSEPLSLEFLRWWEMNRSQDKPEVALIRFEGQRFGSALERSAHGMLWFAVRRKLLPDDFKYRGLPRTDKPIPNRPRNISDVQRRDRMLTALDKLAENKSMTMEER